MMPPRHREEMKIRVQLTHSRRRPRFFGSRVRERERREGQSS